MSGSGSDRSSYEPSASVGPAKQSGGGGGGGGEVDPCAIVQDAPLNSPRPAVIAGLALGNVLDVVATGAPPRRVLEVHAPGAGVAGTLTHVGHLQILRCIDLGNVYQAEVISKAGGNVVVRIERV